MERNQLRDETLLTKRTEHVENLKMESNLSDSDNDIRVQDSQKRKGKE